MVRDKFKKFLLDEKLQNILKYNKLEIKNGFTTICTNRAN